MPEEWADLDPDRLQALVKVGIETDRGPWVAALVAAGYEVFAINPMSVARYRERHSTSGAKSDAADAHVLAEIVRLDRAHHRPVAGDSDEAEAMKLVARSHQSMIWDRTRQVLRLRRRCGSSSRPRCSAFDDLDAPDALELLAAAPDPDRAAPADHAPDHRRAATGEPPRRRRPGPTADPGRSCGPSSCGSPPPVQAAYAAIVSGQVALIADAERPDRRAGRGGGRPFWPSPGR